MDVIIAGAGVAGCHLARKLEERGVNYLLLEPRNVYLKDSGSVSERIFEFYPKVSVKKKIRKLKIVGRRSEIEFKRKKPFAYIIDRVGFWKRLRKSLKISKERVLWVEEKKRHVVVETDENTYKARIVVGADGATSRVRRSLGIKTKLYFGIFGFSKTRYNGYVVHFNKSYGDGFAWQMPSGEYGLISQHNIKKLFEKFQKDLGAKIKKTYSYPVPIGLQKSYSKRAILIGDAASQVKPITFGGVIFSLIAAEIAARHVDNFVTADKNDIRYNLKLYENEWKSVLGMEIALGTLYRRIYSSLPQPFIDMGIESLEIFRKKIESDTFDYDKILHSILGLG